MKLKYHFNRKINKIKKYLFLLKRCLKNFYIFLRRPKIDDEIIILMAYNFNKVGGLEKRIFQYSFLFKRKGYKVLIAAVDGNGSADLWLSKSKLLNTILLKILSKRFHIKVIEYNVGGADAPYFFVRLFQRQIKIGVILHASHISWKIDFLKQCDYVICSHYAHGIRVPYLRQFPVIANAISYHHVCYKFPNQRKALIISRISSDKLPSLRSFIELCADFKICPIIAGDSDTCEGSVIKDMLKKEYNIPDNYFVGPIDTVSFLQKHNNHYLFIGGLGQVILEAGQLGFPCLLCSLLGKRNSFFITKDNIKEVLKLNCSPHNEEETNIVNRDDMKLMFQQLQSGKTEKFNVSRIINEMCLLDNAYKKYFQIVISSQRTLRQVEHSPLCSLNCPQRESPVSSKMPHYL